MNLTAKNDYAKSEISLILHVSDITPTLKVCDSEKHLDTKWKNGSKYAEERLDPN